MSVIVLLLCTVAGASLVQWNRLNENIIASAHDSDIRIWDLRVSIVQNLKIHAHTTLLCNS